MAKKLLTLASCAAFTLAGACLMSPSKEPQKEQLAPVVIVAPTPATAPITTIEAPTPAPIAATIQEPTIATATPAPTVEVAAPIKKHHKAQPAALLAPTPAPDPVTSPSLSSHLGEVATPRVDKDDRPATGNVMSRKANYR